MKKKILLVVISLALVASALTGCGKENVETADIPDIQYENKTTTNINPDFQGDGYALVSSNSRFELYVQDGGKGIKLIDKKTGKEWKSGASSFTCAENFENGAPINPSAYGPEDVPEYAINNKWQQKLQSMFEIFYTNRESGQGAVINLSLEELDYSVTYQGIENGIRILYDIKNSSIKLALDFNISERGLTVGIPPECIEENGVYDITSIKLLPYFADALDSNNGYFFYPDGCGSIMEFKDSAHYLESELSLNVYGDIQKYKNMLFIFDEQDPSIMLPVFGADINGNGFLAVIEKGADCAKIKVNSTNSVLPVNAIYSEFVFRRSFADERVAGNGIMTFDEKFIDSDRSVEYIFLDEGKSEYSDMAVAYRNYLMSDCGLNVSNDDKNIPLSLDLFMGIYEEGMLVDSFKTVTTFEQSQTILEKFKEAGIDDIELQLKGWNEGGYFRDPSAFPPNGKVGGKSGLKNLLEYTKKNNIKLSLENNFIEAREESNEYSKRNDVIYLGNKTIFQKNKRYILSPRASKQDLNEFIKDAEQYAIDGISFYGLGQYVPFNYNSDDYITQGQAVTIWQEMLDKAASEDKFVTVQGGNSYVLGHADKITDLTYKDSGYQLTTKSVPFYQIAVHGLVKYTGKAANLSSDLTKEKLKWVELGYNPYFELTYKGSEDLMYTDYSLLFSSEYESWIEEASSIYKEFNDRLKSVSNALIVNHETISEDLVKVTYDNDKIVYINYSDNDAEVDGVEIKAMDYVVK